MNQFSLPCHCSSSSFFPCSSSIVVRLSSAWRCEYLRRLQFGMSPLPSFLLLLIFVTTWFLLRAVWGSDGSGAGGSHRCWRASLILVIIVKGSFDFRFLSFFRFRWIWAEVDSAGGSVLRRRSGVINFDHCCCFVVELVRRSSDLLRFENLKFERTWIGVLPEPSEQIFFFKINSHDSRNSDDQWRRFPGMWKFVV